MRPYVKRIIQRKITMNARKVCLGLAVALAMALSAGVAIAQPEKVWSRSYGGNGFDKLNGIVQAPDGGFVATGVSDSVSAGGTDVWLMKINEAGDLLWRKSFGGADIDGGNTIIATDSGYVILGYTRSFGAGRYDFWLIGTDLDGDSLWSHTYGFDGDDIGESIIHCRSGGFAICGRRELIANGACEGWIIRTDELGDSLWSSIHETDWASEDYHRLIQTADEGFVATGFSVQRHGVQNYFIVRYDSLGAEMWNRGYGVDVGNNNRDYSSDQCYAVTQTQDGGFALAGYTELIGTDTNIWLLRLDENGDSLWSSYYGGARTDVCFSMINRDDGGFLIGGYTFSYGSGESDILAIRTDADGRLMWRQTYGSENWEYGAYAMLDLGADGIIMVGTNGPDEGNDNNGYIVKTTPDPVSVRDPQVVAPFALQLEQPFPNPFNATVTIPFSFAAINRGKQSLAIFDPLGRRLADFSPRLPQLIAANRHSLTWNASGMPAGQYIVRLEAGNQQLSQRLSLVK